MYNVHLPKSCYEEIVSHCKAGLPDEACGLIAGHIEGNDKYIEKIYPCTNTDHSNEHFTIEPQEQLRVIKDVRAEGLSLLGNFHSHPESPSRQSEEDKRLSYDQSASYLICSLMDKEPVLNSFHFDGKDSIKERLIIE